ncbi:DUF2884 family protein [Alteromonas aestuariivivens]|uniref:DUF2884 family protein n=1 Tax=Alteromonas aestuariivivens TaxID=1938339 RepID=A0A3D8M4D6_9ALTE|nr:YggN family protein [Alteromonas aestuariivivens]RDV24002.1 DUF2884 family protein [Alteromonas aestuariivivens]
MKKSTLFFVISTSLAVTGTVAAHDGSSNDCNVDLQGDLEYYQGVLSVNMDDGSSMSINNQHQLTVNGETVNLDKDQQRWVSDYYDSIDTAIPMTLEIAHDGLEIASAAVGEVLGELLGEDDEFTGEFRELFDSLSDEMHSKFYDQNGNIRVDSGTFDEQSWFDNAWESEFEQRVESLVTQSMGKIMIAVGTQMLWGGGDMEAFEARMENFGEDIEHRFESSADALELKANALCEILAKADYAENHMQQSIPGLSELNLLDVNDSSLKM